MRYRNPVCRGAFAATLVLGLVLSASACASDKTAAPRAPAAPRATATAQTNLTCMPKPSACGFPDATNTGVAAGTQLAPVSGAVTLSTPGEVFENRLVTGSISVTAPNVTIRNVKLVATDSSYGIRSFGWQNNTAGLVIENVEIDLNGHEEIKGIAFDNFTARRVWFHNGLDCAHAGANVTITDSFCDLPKLSAGSAAHADGFQSDGGGNYVFSHNTIRNPNDQTAGILMSTNTGPIDNVVIDQNLMAGGGYTVYCGTDEGGVASKTTYTNNVISREFFPKGGYWGATTWCNRVVNAQGNIWDGSFTLPGGGNPGGGNPNPGGDPGATPDPSAAGRRSRERAGRVARAVLRRELGRRFTRRARLRLACRRRTAPVVACAVKWRSEAGARRYAGKVVITRVNAGARRYTLRVTVRPSGRVVRRAGAV